MSKESRMTRRDIVSMAHKLGHELLAITENGSAEPSIGARRAIYSVAVGDVIDEMKVFVMAGNFDDPTSGISYLQDLYEELRP